MAEIPRTKDLKEHPALNPQEVCKNALQQPPRLDDPLAFATLEPANALAKQAFHEVVNYIRDQEFERSNSKSSQQSTQWYSRFVIAEEPPEVSDGGNYSPSRLPEPRIYQGHFTLSLDILPQYPNGIGWRVGKGASSREGLLRNIDILVVSPRSNSDYCVTSLHASIQFHFRSGALMLKAGPNSLLYYYLDNREIELKNGQQHVLYQPNNRFRVGELEYTLRFEVPDDKKFHHIRDEFFLGRLQQDPPHPLLDAFPREYHRKNGHAIIHNSIGYGSFGWISAGIATSTGNAIAIKEVRVKDSNSLAAVAREVEFAQIFNSNCPGLLETIHIWCEHGTPRPCGKTPEAVYISHPLARGDFETYISSHVAYEDILALFRNTLEGLTIMHHQGLMHRDLTTKNLLVISLAPPVAVICDWGKVSNATTDTNTYLGPIHTLAPEVYHSKLPYNNKIDVWSLAYAWLKTLGRGLLPDLPSKKIDYTGHALLIDRIDKLQRQRRIQKDFGDLLTRMLSWEPQARPSAQQALNYSCWQSATSNNKNQATDDPVAKRPHREISVPTQDVSLVNSQAPRLPGLPHLQQQPPRAEARGEAFFNQGPPTAESGRTSPTQLRTQIAAGMRPEAELDCSARSASSAADTSSQKITSSSAGPSKYSRPWAPALAPCDPRFDPPNRSPRELLKRK